MSGIHDTPKQTFTELAPMRSYAASVRKDIIQMVALIETRDAEGSEAHLQRHLERWRKISNPS